MKKYLIIIIALCGVMLTGCVQPADITDQESDMLAEYMAGIILKHDSNFGEALIELEEIEEVSEATTENTQEAKTSNTKEQGDSTQALASAEPAESKKPTESKEPATSKKAVKPGKSEDIADYMSLTEDMANNKFKIDYVDYTLYDRYVNDPDNNYFLLETSSTRELLVVSFDIKNLSDKKESLDLIGSGFQYQLDVNAGTIYQPMMTLLFNDLQYINLDIASGETKEAVIVFDVLRDIDMSNINLIISNKDKNTIIKLK